MKPGVVVVLNGASSSGKTTVAKAMQERSGEPWLRAGIDRFWEMLPERWMEPGPHAAEGVRWEPDTMPDGTPVVRTRPGPLVQRLARGMHRAVASLAAEGCNVVSDDVILDPDWLSDWALALRDVTAWLVGLHCPAPVLQERERGRAWRQAGEALGQIDTVHRGVAYDLEFDTTVHGPASIAAAILQAAEAATPRAFALLG